MVITRARSAPRSAHFRSAHFRVALAGLLPAPLFCLHVFLLSLFALAAFPAGGVARAQDAGIGTLFGRQRDGQIPDFPSTVIGPGGVIKPLPRPELARPKPPAPKPLTAEERAARIRKALVPRVPLAVARRHTLDDLYAKLAAAKDADEAKGLASLIGAIWLRSGSDTADLLMRRALDAYEKKNVTVALDLLDRVVALSPNWAEAWNQRATVRFYAGNLNGAMSDVEHVLRLEPKHFGALDGMGAILQRTGFDKRALEIYRRALEIYPHQPEVEAIIQKLQLEVEGQGI